jgi:hypothetical protein
MHVTAAGILQQGCQYTGAPLQEQQAIWQPLFSRCVAPFTSGLTLKHHTLVSDLCVHKQTTKRGLC